MRCSNRLVSWLLFAGLSVAMFAMGCGDDDNPLTSTANIVGTLSLPEAAPGKAYFVMVDNNTTGDDDAVKFIQGTCGSGTTVDYAISGVPAGTYYVYAAVCVVSDCNEGPQSGDYLGFYGTGLTIPNAANAEVPESGQVTFDITLAEMGG